MQQPKIIYRGFIEDHLEAPKHLARRVHQLSLCAGARRLSLSNAFTSAFKELEPIPPFKATAKLGRYLERVLGA